MGTSKKNATGKRYSYYHCRRRRGTYEDSRRVAPNCPHMQAQWLEQLVWTDVRGFLHNPGQVLERLREEQAEDHRAEDLRERLASLTKRLAAKQVEKDRYIRLFARGDVLDEEELETYLADLGNQTQNLRLLISSVEADLGRAQEERELAASTEAWLMSLRENLDEVEASTQEAFDKRRELVKLLVEKIVVSRAEDDRPKVDVTYRFGPPEAGECVGSGQNSTLFWDRNSVSW